MMKESPNEEANASPCGFRLPRIVGAMKSSSKNEEDAAPGAWWHLSRKMWSALAFLLLLVLVIALSVYFATRPETVQVIETTAEETLPSLIKVAPIGTAGAILIEYTELLKDNSTVFYYLSIQDLNSTTLDGVTEFDDVALYLTRTPNPTIEEISIGTQNLRRALSPTKETTLRVGLLKNLTFPFKLPDFFLPGNFNGAILVEESRMEESVSLVEVTRASFSVVVDPERNIASYSASPSPTIAPTTKFPTTNPTRTATPSPSSSPSQSPTAVPTLSPTKNPTRSPSLSPTATATPAPSLAPTLEPSFSTSARPTTTHTVMFTSNPSPKPTSNPTMSSQPSLRGATRSPSRNPTDLPSQDPSNIPTTLPSIRPSSVPSITPTILPSASPTVLPTNSPSRRPTRSPTRNPTKLPTAEPTLSPTQAPVPDSGSSSVPPILTAALSGSYRIDGTITIDYVQGFENGQVVNRPRLQFDIPNLSDAPGPYLYLSKRSFSETEGEDLEDDDILIPIDSGEDGQFNVRGRFDQFLDEIERAQDLEDYKNGSWIVWCGPFGVWIGGGEISEA